jgi:hypothetical protein
VIDLLYLARKVCLEYSKALSPLIFNQMMTLIGNLMGRTCVRQGLTSMCGRYFPKALSPISIQTLRPSKYILYYVITISQIGAVLCIVWIGCQRPIAELYSSSNLFPRTTLSFPRRIAKSVKTHNGKRRGTLTSGIHYTEN